jgi:hypothetical protein
MQDWSTPLVVATAAFFALVVWRVRPAMPLTFNVGRKAAMARETFRTARARIEAAKSEQERAIALCDAADIVTQSVAGRASATGLYLRALRSDPLSVEVVTRARNGLASRPRALESLMWRHLAASPWTGPSAGAASAALDALQALYEGPLRSAVRARALANAKDAVMSGSAITTSSSK